MEVDIVRYFNYGRHFTEYHWCEAIMHPIEATFGRDDIGSECEISFTVRKCWSFTDPRKTQELRSGVKQPPTHTEAPFLQKLWKCILGKNSTLLAYVSEKLQL